MKSVTATVGKVLRRCVPSALKAQIPVSLKARARAILGIEPWPDLAIRHPVYRTPEYRALRAEAAPFDRFRKAYKPPIERGHQVSYLVARWFAQSGIRSAFHAGYSNGRYLFYFSKTGIDCGGTELPLAEAPETEVPVEMFSAEVRRRMLRRDFFELRPEDLQTLWPAPGHVPVDVLFTEATFETLIPWRRVGFSVKKYREAAAEARETLLFKQLPGQLAALQACFRNAVLIEPEPDAGGARHVFEACAHALPGLEYSVWRFRPPFDKLFRLSPTQQTTQAVYAYTQDALLLETLRPFADPQ